MKAILACDNDWGIGLDGGLPWGRHHQDLSWFKTQTIDKTVVMGRATWDSGMPQPLPKRRNIVISNRDVGIVETYTFDKFINDVLPNLDRSETIIIGGSVIFELAMPYISDLYISRIAGKFKCDTFLPEDLIKANFKLTTQTPLNGLSIERWHNINMD